MISKLFEDLRVQNFVVLLIFSLLSFAGLMALPIHPTFKWNWFQFQFAPNAPSWLLLSGGILMAFAFWVNFMLAQQFEILKRNLFAGWYIIVLYTGTWGFLGQPIGPFELLIATLAFLQLFLLSRPGNNYNALFNIGWCVGLLSMFQSELLLVLAPMILAIFTYGNVSWRSILLPLLGAGMWLFVTFTFLYITDQPGRFLQHYGAIRAFGKFFSVNYSPLFYGWIGFLALYFLLALRDFFQLASRANIYKRQAFSAILVFFLATLTISLLISNQSEKFFHLLLLPLAILFANMRQYAKNKWYRSFVMWGLPLFILIGFLFQAQVIK